jgi:hypothetical protein
LFAAGADHCEHKISFVKSLRKCPNGGGRQAKLRIFFRQQAVTGPSQLVASMESGLV